MTVCMRSRKPKAWRADILTAYIATGLRAILRTLLFAAAMASSQAGANESLPNLLLIVADDMGYGDLGCMGSQSLRTPAIDRLAASGALCMQAYVASSVCSPSRAGLLTGRDPRRFGYESNLSGRSEIYPTRPELLGLPTTEKTLATQLGSAGYATALIGKWHLGLGPSFHPTQRGFDYFCGMRGGSHTYFPKPNAPGLERDGHPISEFSSPYLTDFFTDEAVRWIADASRPSGRPWFLYLSYNAPHTPMEATEEDLAEFSHVRGDRRRTYAAMMRALDRGVGRVLATLDRNGYGENTLTVFLSDNGGATNNASWNGPLSGSKGTLLEGGVRVPMIWHWPGRIPAGQRVDSVVSALDVLPTFLAAADQRPASLSPPAPHEYPESRHRIVSEYGSHDGADLLPLLCDGADQLTRRFHWRLQGQAAILEGDYKLIRPAHRLPQLFSPASDPGERQDLLPAEQAKAETLLRSLGDWESMLPTAPLWSTSPRWRRASATHYDMRVPQPEPR